MNRTLAALTLVAGLTAAAFGQNVRTTVTASNINDGVNPVTGWACVLPVKDSTGVPAGYRLYGGGQIVANPRNPSCVPVTAGALPSGFQVFDTQTASPSPGVIQLTIKDANFNVIRVDYIQPTGATWNYDTWVPTTTLTIPVGSTFLTGTGAPSGACTQPSIYYQQDSSPVGKQYNCIAGAWVAAPAGSGGSGTITAITTNNGSGLTGGTTTGNATLAVASPVTTVSTTSSTLTVANCNSQVNFTNSSASTAALPDEATALAYNNAAGCAITIKAYPGAGTLSVSPAGANTVEGSTTPVALVPPQDYTFIAAASGNWTLRRGAGVAGAANLTTAYAIPVVSAPGTVTQVAPNTVASAKCLTMTGTGSAGATPTWGSCGSSSGLTQVVQVADPNGNGNACNLTYTSGSVTATSCVYNPLYWVQSGGQSLSTGHNGSPALSTTQPYSNVMLSPSVSFGALPLIPLVEGGTTYDSNANVETPSSGLANYLAAANSSARFGVGLHGYNGQPYVNIAPGTAAYIRGTTQLTAAKQAAIAANYAFVPVAETLTHGEDDYNGPTLPCTAPCNAAITSTTNPYSLYEGYLETYSAALLTTVQAVQPGTAKYPLFISQMNAGWTGEMAQAQWQATLDNPTIFMALPKYPLVYGSDSLHLVNSSYKLLGEYYAKAINYYRVHGTWAPLQMTSATIASNVATVSFNIPVSPLAIDTTHIYAHANYGFTFSDSTSSATVSSVALVGSPASQVAVTLSGVPSGANQYIRYAYACPTGGTSWCGSQNHGISTDANYVGGNIRDSDTTVSPSSAGTGVTLYNWLVSGQIPLPSVPSAPTATATPGTTNAFVAFNVANTSGYPITAVTATSTPGSFTASGTTSPLNVTGLTSGTSYTFAVTSTNAYGTSAATTTNSVTPQSYSPAVSGATAFWALKGTYADYSGNANTAAAGGSGNSFVTDPSSGAPHGTVLQLNGSGYATTPVSATASYTKAAWIYITGSACNLCDNILSNSTGTTQSFFWVNTNTGGGATGNFSLKAGTSNAGVVNYAWNTTAFSLNTWVHVAVTYNSSTGAYTLYQNGTQVATGTNTGQSSGGTLTIGSSGTGATLTGYITNVYYYNSVLTSAQIATLAAQN